MTSGTGTCTVRYDQAGNSNYSAAPEVTETVTAQKAAQSISVTTHAPASAVFGSQFTVAANAPGGAIVYSSSGACSNSGATFTMTSGTGTCTVKYDQAGNANYNAASEVTESVAAQKAAQSITVTTHAPVVGRVQHAVRGCGERAGRSGHLLERGLLLQHRCDVHDDERHRHVHRQVRPGRQCELQRCVRGDRVGDRAEGELSRSR